MSERYYKHEVLKKKFEGFVKKAEKGDVSTMLLLARVKLPAGTSSNALALTAAVNQDYSGFRH